MKNLIFVVIVISAALGGYQLGKHQSAGERLEDSATASIAANSPPTLPSTAALNTPLPAVGTAMAPSASVDEQQTVSRSATQALDDSRQVSDTGLDDATGSDASTDDSYAARRMRAEENFPVAQQEFEEWSKAHTDVLRTHLENLFEDDSTFMLGKIAEENTMLNEPLAQQSIESDLAWRQRMEQQLSDLLTQLNTDPAMRNLQVNCMQMQCEVSMIGEDQIASVKTQMRLEQTKPFGLIKNSSPIFFMQDDKTYWMYMLLQFS